jgi:hypothetical protein
MCSASIRTAWPVGSALHLELGGVPAEGLERLAHLLAVVAVRRARQVLDPRQGRQRGGLRPFLTFGCHLATSPPASTSAAFKYDG